MNGRGEVINPYASQVGKIKEKMFTKLGGEEKTEEKIDYVHITILSRRLIFGTIDGWTITKKCKI